MGEGGAGAGVGDMKSPSEGAVGASGCGWSSGSGGTSSWRWCSRRRRILSTCCGGRDEEVSEDEDRPPGVVQVDRVPKVCLVGSSSSSSRVVVDLQGTLASFDGDPSSGHRLSGKSSSSGPGPFVSGRRVDRLSNRTFPNPGVGGSFTSE